MTDMFIEIKSEGDAFTLRHPVTKDCFLIEWESDHWELSPAYAYDEDGPLWDIATHYPKTLCEALHIVITGDYYVKETCE
jgi:hypothetical protein